MKNLLARVIVIPEKLQTLIVAGIMSGLLWLATWVLQATGIDLTPWMEKLGVAVAGLITFLIKALLERYVPEPAHGIVNAFLAWLALILGGLFVLALL